MEEVERAGKGGRAEQDVGEDVIAEENVGGDTDIAEEDDVIKGKDYRSG